MLVVWFAPVRIAPIADVMVATVQARRALALTERIPDNAAVAV